MKTGDFSRRLSGSGIIRHAHHSADPPGRGARAMTGRDGYRPLDLPALGNVLVRSVELNLETELPRYPDLVALLGYWHGKRGSRRFPARADIDPTDIPAFLPRIMLADVRHDPLDFRYRLVGTGVCDTHWFDFTHMTPRELEPPEYGRLVWDDYAEATRRAEPTAHVVLFEARLKTRYYARIILPLAADGARVDMLMIADSREQNTAELKQMFEAVSTHTGPE